MIDSSSQPAPVVRSRAPTGSLRVRLARFIPLLLLGAACGSGDDHPPPAPAPSDGDHLDSPRLINYDSATADSRDVVADGGCQSGSTQPCRVYLPAHDGIQPCFVGEQRCIESHWGLCADALLVDANKDDAAIDPNSSSGGYGP